MWIFIPLLAAIVWGFDYVISEQVLKTISIYTLLTIELFASAIIIFLIGLITQRFTPDIHVLQSSKQTFLLVLVGVITFTLANAISLFAIHIKDATLASIIEITYPIFIIAIAYFLFKEKELNTSILIGGIFIFLGVIIISIFNH